MYRFLGQGRGNRNIHGQIGTFLKTLHLCMDVCMSVWGGFKVQEFVCVAPFPRPAWAKLNIHEKIVPL